MIKYTFDPRLRWQMFEQQTPNTRWWDTQWNKRVEFIMEINADRKDIFRISHALNNFTCYYSEKELEFVPVGGWLIPVEYFEVEII